MFLSSFPETIMPFTLAKRPGQGMFGRAAGGLSDGEFPADLEKMPWTGR